MELFSQLYCAPQFDVEILAALSLNSVQLGCVTSNVRCSLCRGISINCSGKFGYGIIYAFVCMDAFIKVDCY